MTDQTREALIRDLVAALKESPHDNACWPSEGHHSERCLRARGLIDRAEAVLLREAEDTPEHEGTCNPYRAECGATFCSYEEMAEHDRRFHFFPNRPEPGETR